MALHSAGFCCVELCGPPSAAKPVSVCFCVGVGVRKSNSVYSGGHLNGFSRARLNRKPLAVVFVHRKALCFPEEQLSFSSKAGEHRQTSPLLRRMLLVSHIHKHPAPSFCLNQCLSPLFNSKVIRDNVYASF
ncbi:hypothetical protein XENOCAPTIV_021773, partial [Xenoophorus captivus]